MIKNLLRKNQINESFIDAQATDTGDSVNTGVKTKSPKIQLISVLIFLLLAGLGFAGMTFIATDNSSDKKIQGPCRQLAGMQPCSQSSPLPVAPHAQQAPVQNAEGKKQRAESTVLHAEDRDVFKEFYLRHVEQGATLTKGPAMHLEQNLPDLTRLVNANGGAQALPPVQILNTAPVNEQSREVKIFGITCFGENGLPDDKCVAITSEGVLKKGDKLGSETVFAVNKTSFETSKRTVEFN